MINPSEILNNPRAQNILVQNAERLFGLERILEHPSVVFDRGFDDFWTTAMNSQKKPLVLEKISSGELIPINSDALGDIAQVHTVFHVYIAEAGMGIPTIPTIANVIDKPSIVGEHQLPKEIPNIWVKKTSYKEGKMTSHRGEGVSVVRIESEEDWEAHLPKNRWELLQPFVVPPDDFVRDIRVYVVGGKPVAGFIRRARKPLLPENLSGKKVPSLDQFPSAQRPGPSDYLEGAIKDVIFNLSSKICQVLEAKVRTRARPFSPYSTFGFGSIDFLLDANSTPLPVDFDINPSVTKFANIDYLVAEQMAEYLHSLSTVNGRERDILLVGFPRDKFLELISVNLKNQLPEERVIFQESIISRAMKEGVLRQQD